MITPTSFKRGTVWICSFLPPSEGRGIERFVMQLSETLTRDGWNVEVVDLDAISHGKGLFRTIRPLAAWRIGTVVNSRAKTEDVIVCNNMFSWNARRGKSIVVYHMTEKGRALATRHKMSIVRNFLVRVANSRLDKRTGMGRKVVAVSGMVKNEVERLYGLHVDEIIRNAVDLDVFRPSGTKQEWRRALGLPIDEFLVLHIGPPDKKKGLDLITEGILPGIRHSQRLVVVSDVKIQDEAVTVVGRVGFDKIHEYYKACDVLLFPSYYEGWGITVAEAMASGLPCVVSMTGIGCDLMEDISISRYVVQSHEPDEYIRLLLSLQQHPEELERQSQAVRRYAEAHYGADWFEEAYQRLLEEVSNPQFV